MTTVDVVRVDFALIPDDPLFGAVVRANQAITDEFSYNQNIIDENYFPPHLSLLICTVPRDEIDQVVVDLRALAEEPICPTSHRSEWTRPMGAT